MASATTSTGASGGSGTFVRVKQRRLRAWVREDVRAALLPLLGAWASGTLATPRAVAGGRGGAGVFDVAADLAVVLRPYRRGGLVGRFNRDLYLGFRPRPLRELRVTLALRDKGVPTIEPLAAAVRWIAPGLYRGAFVTRHLPLAVNLWQYLHDAGKADRGRACEAAASAIRKLHDAGAIHPDLNLMNLLVRPAAGGREVLIIDFDRARLSPPVSTRQREAAFARLCRSMRRLDPTAEVVTLDCVEAFHAVAAPAESRTE
jgi:tRNA A-37 threonylcarbamoyl transferase component Bud32